MSKLPMNLPNKITLARILFIPIYLFFLAQDTTLFRWVAAAIFFIAALSDMVDGMLARKNNQITDFGKFMDPIADKLLVLLPFIYFCHQGAEANVWAVVIMVAREIIVSGFRLVAVTRGQVIAAGMSGKMKTSVQVVAVLMLTLGIPFAWLATWIAAALSAYSGWEILWKNRRMLEEGE